MAIQRPDILVTKNRDFGETGLIKCKFDKINRRVFQANIGDRTIYGWDHTDIDLPLNPANELPEFGEVVEEPEGPF